MEESALEPKAALSCSYSEESLQGDVLILCSCSELTPDSVIAVKAAPVTACYDDMSLCIPTWEDLSLCPVPGSWCTVQGAASVVPAVVTSPQTQN